MTTPPPPSLRPAVFDGLAGVVAGFSTRQGGHSPAPYVSLNLGLSTDDEAAHVAANRRRLFESVGFSVEHLAMAGQVHGAVVRHVTQPGLFQGCDALVTQTPGLVLCISAADCAAVLLADAEAGVVGACHAGWRGTVARVVVHTVTAMRRLGAASSRLHAYVSPCISAAHFEVGPEVAARFEPAYVHQRPNKEKPHVDLKAAIAGQLEAVGVPPPHIEVSPHCTFAETNLFFSHRAEKGRTGRMMGFVGMRVGPSPTRDQGE